MVDARDGAGDGAGSSAEVGLVGVGEVGRVAVGVAALDSGSGTDLAALVGVTSPSMSTPVVGADVF